MVSLFSKANLLLLGGIGLVILASSRTGGDNRNNTIPKDNVIEEAPKMEIFGQIAEGHQARSDRIAREEKLRIRGIPRAQAFAPFVDNTPNFIKSFKFAPNVNIDVSHLKIPAGKSVQSNLGVSRRFFSL